MKQYVWLVQRFHSVQRYKQATWCANVCFIWFDCSYPSLKTPNCFTSCTISESRRKSLSGGLSIVKIANQYCSASAGRSKSWLRWRGIRTVWARWRSIKAENTERCVSRRIKKDSAMTVWDRLAELKKNDDCGLWICRCRFGGVEVESTILLQKTTCTLQCPVLDKPTLTAPRQWKILLPSAIMATLIVARLSPWSIQNHQNQWEIADFIKWQIYSRWVCRAKLFRLAFYIVESSFDSQRALVGVSFFFLGPLAKNPWILANTSSVTCKSMA